MERAVHALRTVREGRALHCAQNHWFRIRYAVLWQSRCDRNTLTAKRSLISLESCRPQKDKVDD